MPDFFSTIKNRFSPEARPLPPEQKDALPSPETPKAPEIQKESEQVRGNIEGGEEPQAPPLPPAGQVSSQALRAAPPRTKTERLVAIEGVMASGLEEIYVNLDDSTKQMLKIEGEKTATQIEILLEQGKDVAKKILHLIRAWLHKIPGVNKFFLEQESKIKTDKIMAMNKRENNF